MFLSSLPKLSHKKFNNLFLRQLLNKGNQNLVNHKIYEVFSFLGISKYSFNLKLRCLLRCH